MGRVQWHTSKQTNGRDNLDNDICYTFFKTQTKQSDVLESDLEKELPTLDKTD